ncbi:acetylornithine/N-succinyldiaminopimelate aminotransferase [Streptomyces aurantiacus]|nr:acetylornithine/N-succinyldiaminopimelate aminotransferase [Streptomyces aurantiacus]
MTADEQPTANEEPTANLALTRRWQGALMDNYGTPRLPLVRGAGTKLWDADGTEYLDFVGGIAVNALGHAHPAIVEAVSRQIASLGHVSNLFVAEPPVALAERLLQLFGRDGRVYFCNSGAEANEGAFKIGRLTGRGHMVATDGGFHGRTMGALALTGQPGKRDPFLPLPGDVTHVPYGDPQALAAAVTEDTALVVIEPVQGENGVVVPPPGYLKAARAITAATGSLLVLDEVQTGIGRSGHWFEYQAHEGVLPDVVTLAKGLGGGLPLGATVAFGRAAQFLKPGHHGTTFGGNPVACAAGLAVLDTIETEGLLENVKAGRREAARGDRLPRPPVDRPRPGRGPPPGYRAHRAARTPRATGGSGRRPPGERARPRCRTADAAPEHHRGRGGRVPPGSPGCSRRGDRHRRGRTNRRMT